MEYLLVMSFSGSVMTGVCLLLRFLFKNKVSAKLYYLLAKAAALYYVIPLPFLKGWYKAVLRQITPERPMGIQRVSPLWTNVVIWADHKMYFNDYAIIQVILAIVCLVVVCFLAVRMLSDYIRTCRVIAGCADQSMTECQQEFLAGIKAQYGVKRHVILSRGYAGANTMTFGVCHPIIICDREADSREAKLLVSHEMVHIKRWDLAWKILIQLVVILHWWNPVVRILRHNFEVACECSCDEMVLQGRTEEEWKEYRNLIIREALAQKETEKEPLRWKACFGEKQSEIKERVDNLMNRKRWNRLGAAVLVAVLAFANSMTVFAYRDTFQEVVAAGTPQEDIERTLECDTFLFVPDGISEEERQKYTLLQRPEIRYDMQFTDEEGNIYPIRDEDTASTYRACSHTYESGTVTDHKKQADGSCEVIIYSSQRCSKCGKVIKGEQVGWYKYDVCPH
ncbi:MAG: M56 family metallopeptidase [Lachnospiraceae bacterium]|nr:M56 family metallopeptidase [Lachnospiraceae bacterium]